MGQAYTDPSDKEGRHHHHGHQEPDHGAGYDDGMDMGL